MTAIWDRLGGTAYTLSYTNPWTDKDHKYAEKVKTCMTAVYNCIKDRPEYQDLTMYIRSDLKTLDTKPNMIAIFKAALERPVDKTAMSDLADVVSRLHTFDHSDIPTEFGSSFGHHTEVVIYRKRTNKQYAKALPNAMLYDYWWDEEK